MVSSCQTQPDRIEEGQADGGPPLLLDRYSKMCVCWNNHGNLRPLPPCAPSPPPSRQVDVLVEMKDATTVIPRNSLIEANQSGLIAEPLIDITPQAPVPEYKGACWGGLGECKGECRGVQGCVPGSRVGS